MSAPLPLVTETAPPAIRGLRRAAIITAIVSLSITAIVGIITLLSGDWGETQGRVMGTTLIIGALGILALADLTVAGRRMRWLGWAGAAIAVATAALGILIVWGAFDDVGGGNAFKYFIVGIVLSIAVAQSCVLLLLERVRHPFIRIALPITLAFVAIVTVMILLPILTDGEIPGRFEEPYWRGFGVALILAVLGSVVLPVMGLVLRGRGGQAPATPATTTAGLSVPIPDELAAALQARAAETGVTPQAFVLDAVRERLG